MATKTETAPDIETYKLQLHSGNGPVYRDVLRTSARDCDPSEVPVIDLSNISGTKQERHQLAQRVREAATNTGFFYIKNHGVDSETIRSAHHQARAFFVQSLELKEQVSRDQSKDFNGWSSKSKYSPTESQDRRESFTLRYDPRYDPEHKDLSAIPEQVKKWLCVEDFIWEQTSHLPGFQQAVLKYWQDCLQLSRRLLRLFALALDVSEDYFDQVTTYPGSDCVLNYYPSSSYVDEEDVGIGAHTDMQCFTLLWQDTVGGLQVLTKAGQWINVPPVQDTFVVNIADFLMRLSNDRFQSTVHRVKNVASTDRFSMPFFFGFNFDQKCSVLPSCIDENNPPKYEPISCGEWRAIRLATSEGVSERTKQA